MRVVAGAAVLRNRIMRMDEGAALFGMTGKAGVVDAVALNQFGAS